MARFLAALHDIDGVTRVTVLSSHRPEAAAAGRERPERRRADRQRRRAQRVGSSSEFDRRGRSTRFSSRRSARPLAHDPRRADHHHAHVDVTAQRLRTASSTADQSQVADAEQQLQQQKDSGRREVRQGPEGREHVHSRDGVGAVRRNELTIVVVRGGARADRGLLAARARRRSARRRAISRATSPTCSLRWSRRSRTAAAGQQARKSFPIDYRKLVVLGKAVPADADQSSLLVQLQQLADRSGVEFRSIELTESQTLGRSSTPPPSTSTDHSTRPRRPRRLPRIRDLQLVDELDEPTTEPTPPRRRRRPRPCRSGPRLVPAGLPVMRYRPAVHRRLLPDRRLPRPGQRHGALRSSGAVVVDGRLAHRGRLHPSPIETEDQNPSPVPTLTADLSVTTYLTPADQGTIAGATPTGPAPSGSTSTTPPASAPRHRPRRPPDLHDHPMKNMRMPRFLDNLYRDMRDRRTAAACAGARGGPDRGPDRAQELLSSPRHLRRSPRLAAAGERDRTGGRERAARGDQLPQAARPATDQESLPSGTSPRCPRAPS